MTQRLFFYLLRQCGEMSSRSWRFVRMLSDVYKSTCSSRPPDAHHAPRRCRRLHRRVNKMAPVTRRRLPSSTRVAIDAPCWKVRSHQLGEYQLGLRLLQGPRPGPCSTPALPSCPPTGPSPTFPGASRRASPEIDTMLSRTEPHYYCVFGSGIKGVGHGCRYGPPRPRI